MFQSLSLSPGLSALSLSGQFIQEIICPDLFTLLPSFFHYLLPKDTFALILPVSYYSQCRYLCISHLFTPHFNPCFHSLPFFLFFIPFKKILWPVLFICTPACLSLSSYLFYFIFFHYFLFCFVFFSFLAHYIHQSTSKTI